MAQAGIPRLHVWKEAAIASGSLADSKVSMGPWQGGGRDQMGRVTPSLTSLPTRPGENPQEAVSWECPLTRALREPGVCDCPRILIARGSLHWGRKWGPKPLTSHGTDT